MGSREFSLRVRMLVGMCLWVICAAAVCSELRQPEPEPEVVRAAALLDSWSGEGAHLANARRELDSVLKRDPASAPAYREYARYYLLDGFINSEAFEPGTLEAALKAVDRAIELSPHYANAYVLKGHVLTLMKAYDQAESALDKAQSIGTDDPWLVLNRANLRLEQGRYDEAGRLCGEVSANSSILRIRSAADQCLIDFHRKTDRRELNDAVYKRILTYEPESAWTHGDYASYLLCSRDDPEGATREARTALKLMNYGVARRTLAAALYRTWSAQWNPADPEAGQRYFDEAASVSRAPAEDVIAAACTGGKGALAGLRALYLSGRIQARSPADAIARAAEVGSNGTPGVFELEVVGSGKDAQNVYLNSLADYRDPANLTIHIVRPAADALARQYGQPADAYFRGKRIVVVGYVRRERIDYRDNGVPTGRWYYQTHLWVTFPQQMLEMSGGPPVDGAGAAAAR